jgi:hypothetical protein
VKAGAFLRLAGIVSHVEGAAVSGAWLGITPLSVD